MEVSAAEVASLRALVQTWVEGRDSELELHFREEAGAAATALSYEAFMGVVRALRLRGFGESAAEQYATVTVGGDLRVTFPDARTVLRPHLEEEALRSGGGGIVVVRKRRLEEVRSEEYGWAAALKEEAPQSTEAALSSGWRDKPKTYRLLQRCSVYDAQRLPGVRVDLSIVYASRGPLRAATDGGFVTAAGPSVGPHYEVEVEAVRGSTGDAPLSADTYVSSLLRAANLIVQALQGGCSAPLKRSEVEVARAYLLGLYAGGPNRRFVFPGPQPVTLTRETAAELAATPTCVTDKADGARVLFVWPPGARRPALLDTSLRPRGSWGYSGEQGPGLALRFAPPPTPECWAVPSVDDTVLDGELVTSDGEGRPVEWLLLFDAYRVAGSDVTGMPLWVDPPFTAAAAGAAAAEEEEPPPLELLPRAEAEAVAAEETEETEEASVPAAAAVVVEPPVDRLAHLRLYTAALRRWARTVGRRAGLFGQLRLWPKRFLPGAPPEGGVDAQLGRAGQLLATLKRPYPTDGLIFTPTALPVAPHMGGRAWRQALKWKPAESATVDFLVRFPPCGAGPGARSIRASLFVASTTRRPTGGDPSADLLQLPGAHQAPRRSAGAVATPFVPLDPYEEGGGVAVLSLDPHDQLPRAASGEPVFTESVVEMAWVEGAWAAQRVRHDKTLRWHTRVPGSVMNAEPTALAVWQSIHAPVKLEAGGAGSSSSNSNREPARPSVAYYAPSDPATRARTHCMRLFHSHVVKGLLLLEPALARMGPAPLLLDLAVGKAQDLNRWRDLRVAFVLGVDLNADSLFEAPDSAARRVLRSEEAAIGGRTAVVLALGDVTRPLGTGEAGARGVDAALLRTLLGSAGQQQQPLHAVPRVGRGCELLRAAGHRFDVVTIFFAMHYFFADEGALRGVLANVANHLRVGGLLLVTCLDGERVGALLADVPVGGWYWVGEDNVPRRTAVADAAAPEGALWAIRRMYEGAPSRTGSEVRVLHDRIRPEVAEYLVQPAELVAAAARIGCELSTTLPDLRGAPRGSASFEAARPTLATLKLHVDVGADLARNPAIWRYSALHRYYVFERTRMEGGGDGAARVQARVVTLRR